MGEPFQIPSFTVPVVSTLNALPAVPMEKSESGEVVAMPTKPLPSTLKSVALVELATENIERFGSEEAVVVETESIAKGVVVPIPTLPDPVIRILSIREPGVLRDMNLMNPPSADVANPVICDRIFPPIVKLRGDSELLPIVALFTSDIPPAEHPEHRPSKMATVAAPVVLTLNFTDGEVVPMPTFPLWVTMKSCRVDEPIANSGNPTVARLLVSIENLANGLVVAIPTLPPASTTKLVAVDEPIEKAGPVMPFGLIESCAHGVVVPIPIEPSEEMKIEEVAWAVPASFPTRKLPLARALETGVKPKRDEVAANARALPVAFE